MDHPATDNTNPAQSGWDRLWTFLNSNFGLFVMSSIVVSSLTWAYTEFSQSIETRKLTKESVTKLSTEVSYRIQLLEIYFDSECMDLNRLKQENFDEIRKIYQAGIGYQSIFPENKDKELHILLWELSALQEVDKQLKFQAAFKAMLGFNTDLNRHTNIAINSYAMPMEPQGEVADLKKKIDGLIGTFKAAIEPIRDEFSL